MSAGLIPPVNNVSALTTLGLLIQEQVTSGSAASVTFSSIPATYRDLLVKVRGRGTTAANDVLIYLQFNTDTGNNYSGARLVAYSTGSATGGDIATDHISTSYIPASTGAATFAGVLETLIGDYRGTTFYKGCVTRGLNPYLNTAGNFQLWVSSAAWLSTSAITSVKVYPSAGSFVDGTVISIYGLY